MFKPLTLLVGRTVCPSANRRLITTNKTSFTPDDYASVFQHTSTYDLLRAFAIFETCSKQQFTNFGRQVLSEALEAKGARKLPFLPILSLFKNNVFPHFCAGETLQDCKAFYDRHRPYNIRVIVDHSKEEDERPEAHAFNLSEKIKLLRDAKSCLGDGVLFVPVKVTALASPLLLEQVTRAIVEHPTWRTEPADPSIKLSASQMREYGAALDNLSRLTEEAGKNGMRLLLDAEQTDRQLAIDHLAVALMQQFNKKSQTPIVYNTYQFYLEDARDRFERDLLLSQRNGFSFAAKMVRGAYIVTEKARSGQIVSNIQPSKAATDQAYDSAVAYILREMNAYPGTASVVIASHNKFSVERAVALMDDLELAHNNPDIHFAQIMGMCDNITAALGLAGYNSHKLVLFGDFNNILPWLLRRLDENHDTLSAMAQERHAIKAELRRRSKHRSS